MSLLTKLFHYVLLASSKYNIDESHGLSHSMDVLNFAHNIYINELPDCPFLKEQEKVIYTAAILHDMCDKKYVNEDEGIRQIEDFLQDYTIVEKAIKKVDIQEYLLKDSTIKALQENYHYLLWSILAIGIVIVGVNVLKKKN